MVLRTVRCYDSNDEQIILGNNTKQWRYKREQYRLFIGPLADSIFDFAHSIAKMRLDQAELVLLMAIAIFTGKYYLTVDISQFSFHSMLYYLIMFKSRMMHSTLGLYLSAMFSKNLK